MCVFVIPLIARGARGEEPAVPFCPFALNFTFIFVWQEATTY